MRSANNNSKYAAAIDMVRAMTQGTKVRFIAGFLRGERGVINNNDGGDMIVNGEVVKLYAVLVGTRIYIVTADQFEVIK